MISITLSQAAAILQGDLYGQDLTIDAVTTDTRKITAGCLFVALKGERFDAHDFAQQAKEHGAGALLVSRRLDIDLPHDLRHTWATWHYQANRDFTALKKLGGWKTDAMMLRYAHTNTSEFAASINRMPGGNAAGTEG